MRNRQAGREVTEPRASIIVRTKNSSETLERTLESIRVQDLPNEIIVVDSGSTDDTIALALRYNANIIEIKPQEFSFGRALNLGAERALAPVHVALSSHCAFPREDWLSVAADNIARGAFATVGMGVDAQRRPLDGPFEADCEYLNANKHWGLSNHASAWSRAAWERHRFDEGLAASEDKEWSWRASRDDLPLIVDPRLIVPGDHRRAPGLRPYYRRLKRELLSIERVRPLSAYSLHDAVRDWLAERPYDPYISASRRRGRTRAVEVAARWSASSSASNTLRTSGRQKGQD